MAGASVAPEAAITDAIRPFWAPGLAGLTTASAYTVRGWVARGDFPIYQPILPDQFRLEVQSGDERLVAAFATDIARFAAAAFETWGGIERHPAFPRATAWAIIRVYYAAYYAAHALVRVLGTSCSQLGMPEVRAVHRAAVLYGQASPAGPPTKGVYACEYDRAGTGLVCARQGTSVGGTHQVMWALVSERLKQLSADVLGAPGLAAQQQQVAGRLDDVRAALATAGAGRSDWLSELRNAVTYRLELGAWHPYAGRSRRDGDAVFSALGDWRTNPLRIRLPVTGEQDLVGFTRACACVVSLCRVTLIDLAARSPGVRALYRGPLTTLGE